ncbi:MAG TPA: phosphatase PAP2 family protein [Xanthobacteraceae bacterium]|nr:phosphatase PAP2 family protein [Xanthobacteraceae bacterium]
MTRVLKVWLVCLALTVLAVWVSYLWLDKPVALWVNRTVGAVHVPAKLIGSPLSSTSFITAFAFVVCGLVAISGRRFLMLGTTITLCVVSAVSTILIKDQLKLIFGRTWPDTWGQGILSLVRDGVYGFHYFQYGRSFESFPSGHAALTAAVLSVPCFLFPKLRAGVVICIVVIDASLVMLNLHFLGDVIAGTFVGFSSGLFTVYLWRATYSRLAAETTPIMVREFG